MKEHPRQPVRLTLKRNPAAPQTRRIDVIVGSANWEMFRDIRDSMNLTQRQALEFALQLAFIFQTVQGKISAERFTELAPMLMPKSKRGKGGEGDPESGEPQPML